MNPIIAFIKMIYDVAVSYCAAIYASNVVSHLCFIIYVFVSSSVVALPVKFPPFDNLRSFDTILKDPSLVPPYGLRQQPDNLDANAENTIKRDRPGSEQTDMAGIDPATATIHFCFIVHGYQGLSGDLSYFETVLKNCAEKEFEQLQPEKSEIGDDFVKVPSPVKDNTDPVDSSSSIHQELVVHNCVCNEGKTTDGVANGGDRLVNEIRQTIDSKMKKWQSVANDGSESKANAPNITISIIGNSMGGLYGRYAIAKLIEKHCVPTQGKEREQQRSPASWILDGYRLRLETFCTTSSPHLGVSQHTWIRVPRLAELLVATGMGETGRDLFRVNNLLYTMATDKAFLDPLASFRKRIAYANCYGTDFPVPLGTAAFLSEESTYSHQLVENFKVEDDCNLVIATLQTNADKFQKTDTDTDELHQMSVALDGLGWKKVFVDLRKEMFTVELPWLDSLRPSPNTCDLSGLKERKTVESKYIANAFNIFKANNADDERMTLRLPFGHNMIVGFSRSRMSSFLNRGGRPLVDSLSKELVGDIFESGEKKAC